jgi:DNA-binding HxlR family transcriptional regulator
MTRTHEKVRHAPESKPARPVLEITQPSEAELTPVSAARRVEQILKILEGRWKLAILFQLFGGKVLRFSELERAIPAVSQKMLIQQLRQMEADGLVQRMIYPEVPPRVEYGLSPWGQALCPTLDSLLKWSDRQQEMTAPAHESAIELTGIHLIRR